ncbi:HAD-IA family hydrolase [Liquorilactobacillus oeni]|uniref:Phosphoglycolate phosphatase n=1 Tax=Liquorilactobacillus oeni DSM 19972 TaxID=1423777 RepID=A0A0R1MIP6_9LACO|nr:HAD-IA family hydrolase [Liquorilactobacillus oeni]KRL04299.1 phosphoglycolate phosphatase [Liquorilactobacillus oeni DSM 19972]
MSDYCWDFDGTLYNTYPSMVKAFCNAFREAKIEIAEHEVYLRMRRTSLGQTFAFYTADLEESLTQKIKHFYKLKESAERNNELPFDGAYEVCWQIVAAGGRNFLLTHRDKSALQMLKRDKMTAFFCGAVTAQNNFPRKPDPSSLNYLCRKYLIERKNAVMIGDRPLDVEAGRRAGMKGYLFDPDNTIIQPVNYDRRLVSLLDVLS